ncbi:hypothetical protein BJV77DRAFT_988231 [Russula vinacea]|nr:hypothetical protein BJV77DRAFT_988231 [Russula vinacea]
MRSCGRFALIATVTVSNWACALAGTRVAWNIRPLSTPCHQGTILRKPLDSRSKHALPPPDARALRRYSSA